MTTRNYYTILGVQQSDTADDIKKAYRKLAKENHPDLHPGDKEAEEKFKEISEAWETLGDQGKRKAYDESLADHTPKQPIYTGNTASKSQARRTTMNQAEYDHLMQGFEQYFNPDKIKPVGGHGKNSIDTTSMFDRYMGFSRFKKK